jgi:hypothetical protein
MAEVRADGLKPLTTSQMPSDSSQAATGMVAVADHTETCS